MAERPGIMVYFDLLETLKDYSTEEAGQLFLAMLEYGATGAIPEFDDRGMRTVWRSVQQKIDRDDEHYQETVEGRRYATFCREFKKKHGENSNPPSFEEWKKQNQMISNDDFDIQLQPQPTTATSTSNAKTTGRGKGNGDTGERERGTFALTEDEWEKKREMGLRPLEGYRL